MTYRELLQRYTRKHGALVGPKSLVPELHLAFSMGIKRSFTNLGTYADKPGDHGYYPSWAFDLGRSNRFFFKGFNYLVARRYCYLLAKHYKALNIRYIILGDRIWHRDYGYWQKFRNYNNDKSHDFHIHVSGQRP